MKDVGFLNLHVWLWLLDWLLCLRQDPQICVKEIKLPCWQSAVSVAWALIFGSSIDDERGGCATNVSHMGGLLGVGTSIVCLFILDFITLDLFFLSQSERGGIHLFSSGWYIGSCLGAGHLCVRVFLLAGDDDSLRVVLVTFTALEPLDEVE